MPPFVLDRHPAVTSDGCGVYTCCAPVAILMTVSFGLQSSFDIAQRVVVLNAMSPSLCPATENVFSSEPPSVYSRTSTFFFPDGPGVPSGPTSSPTPMNTLLPICTIESGLVDVLGITANTETL